jgi:hypothetical protein
VLAFRASKHESTRKGGVNIPTTYQVPSIYYGRHRCEVCDKPIGWADSPEEGGLFQMNPLPVYVGRKEHRAFVQICAQCFAVEEALAEANESRARFTKVDAQNRCPCGSVAYSYQSWCIPCWRRSRMLDEQQAAATLNRKILKTLKELAKNAQDNRRTA